SCSGTGSTGDRIGWPVEAVSLFDFVDTLNGSLCVLLRKLASQISATKFLRHRQSGSAAGEGVENQIARVGTYTDNPTQKLLRHLATMETLTLLEGSSDTGEVPCVVERAEPVGIRLKVLRA